MILSTLESALALSLQTDFVRASEALYQRDLFHFEIEGALSDRLVSFSKRENVTPSRVLISVLKAMFYRYTGQDVILIGVSGLHPISKTTVLQTEVDRLDSLLSMLKKIELSIWHAQSNFGNRKIEENKAFNVTAIFLEKQSSRSDLVNEEQDRNDLEFYFSFKSKKKWEVSIAYNSCLFKRDRIQRMSYHFITLLSSSISNPLTSFRELRMLTDREVKDLLSNTNTLPIPEFTSIHAWVENQVRITPDAIAVMFGEAALTYAELNEKSNQLAAYLISSYEVRQGNLVGVMLPRNEWMIVVLLGILKTGAAYLPIDQRYPKDRVTYMLADSGVNLLITQKEFWLLDSAINQLDFEQVKAGLSKQKTNNLLIDTSSKSIAYIIYTSGSTGKPKGVVISHDTVLALIAWAHKEYAESKFDTIYATTSYCFDLSIFEMFFSLSAGKTIRVLESGLDIPTYSDKDKNILVNTVPSVVDALLQTRMDWRNINVLNMAGEPISMHIKEALDLERMEVRNLYGPSEDTTYSSCYRLRPDDTTIFIGKAIENTQFYIVDESLNLLPKGIPGEIAIGGMGLAMGYLNRPMLTSEKFIESTRFAETRLYLTGDIGLLNDNGEFEFLGRKDNQVKIRGFRIELGEVETALLVSDAVRQALIVAQTRVDGEKYLVAYYTGVRVPQEGLQGFLRKTLPDYMVPSYILYLEKFPLTPNGKIDRKALPDPIFYTESQPDIFIEPENETEQRLVEIWEEILGKKQISRNDNFFSLGGHSLKGVRLLTSVLQRMNSSLQLTDIFAHPTVAEMTLCIQKRKRSTYAPIPKVDKQDLYDLSPGQLGIWIVDQMEDDLTVYTIPYVYKINNKALNIQVLEKALQSIITRHEILRTIFVTDSGRPKQKVLTPDKHFIKFKFTDLSQYEDQQEKIDAIIRNTHFQPFNLSEGPLLRVELIKNNEQDYLLVLAIHHIIFDDLSSDVFIREWCLLYDSYIKQGNNALPELSVQHKDVSGWIHRQLSGSRSRQLQEFWVNSLSGSIPLLMLPTDFERPAGKDYAGDILSCQFSSEFTNQLLKFSKQQEATMFICLLTALNTMFYGQTGQEDIIIGTPVATRSHPDLQDQIGLLINTLALRTKFSSSDTFQDLLKKVKAVFLEAHSHQDYPFDQLVEVLDCSTQLSRSPLFDALAVFNKQEQEFESELTLESQGMLTTGAKFDLEFYFVQTNKGFLNLSVVYKTSLFKRERIQSMIEQFQQLLQSVVERPTDCLNDLIQSQPQPISIASDLSRNLKPEVQEQVYTTPRNLTESKILEIWKEVFKMDKISTSANFHFLGGHSIKAMQVKAKVAQNLGAEIKIKDVFKHNTIQLLSAHIERGQLSAEQTDSRRIKYAPIRPTEKKEYYPLSAVQRPLYMVQQIDVDSIAYNIIDIIPVSGEVDIQYVKAIVKQLVSKHEVLRTSFNTIDGTPYQFIHDTVKFEIQTYESFETDIKSLVRNIVKPFDLAQAPLFRFFYVTGNLGPLFLVDIHHIISDAISTRTFYEEFDAIAKGIPANDSAIQYKDFAVWLDQSKRKKWMLDQQSFWYEQLEGDLPLLQLPTDFERPKVKTYNGSIHQFILNKKIVVPLRAFCRLHNTSLFTALLSAYYVFLMKMSGQRDIIIGVPSTFRNNNSLGKMLGMFVNTLPIRMKMDGRQSFTDLLLNIKRIFLQILDNQDYQLDDLISNMAISRDSSRSPLYDVMFNLLNQMEFDINMDDVRSGKPSQYDSIISAQFDLVLQGIEAKQDILFAFSYNTDLFRRETIERFSRYFENIIKAMVKDPLLSLMDIDFISEEEKDELLKLQYRKSDYVVDKTIVDMFLDCVQKHPDQIAAVCGERKLSYSEVDQWSDALADKLLNEPGKHGGLIPVLLDKNINMPVTLWGVLKAGFAFVPLSPEWPIARIHEILNDIRSSIVISNVDRLKNELYAYHIIEPDSIGLHEKIVNTKSIAMDQPIYVIYTSGTTGKPKGAINLHKALANRFMYLNKRYQPVNSDVMLLTNNYVFDGAVYQLLWPMTAGFKTVIPESTDYFDLEQITKLIDQEKVTIADFVPSVLAVLTDMVSEESQKQERLRTLRQLIIGGEAMNANVAYTLKKLLPNLSVTNDYGPTETAISTIFYELPEKPLTVVPIGRPMDNVKAVILDEYGKLVPTGVSGELYLGGDCLGKGYWNRQDLTDRVFVKLFVKEYLGEVFYKTGDQVKMLSDGNIEFISRIDNQIKIRGFRIEPEEIENVLRQYPGIKDAVVTIYQDSGEKQLVGYYTGSASVDHIRQHLQNHLPEYMVPFYILSVTRFPLLSTGKVDKRALPNPTINLETTDKVAPRNRTESKLKNILSELLSKKSIGIYDDFFLMGGHSLRAIQLIHRISREFDVDLKLKYIFERPTIAAISEQIVRLQNENKRNTLQITPVDAAEYYPASNAQKRLWFIDKFEVGGGVYNIPGIYKVQDYLNEDAFERALYCLIERHESLRTSFQEIDGIIMQRITPSDEVILPIAYNDFKNKSSQVIEDFIHEEHYRGFDLSKSPLFRIKVIKSNDNTCVIICTTHHIISDGISTEIFIKELIAHYEAFSRNQKLSISPLAIQYKDYASWQRRQLDKGLLKEHKDYWLNQLNGGLPIIILPYDCERPTVRTHNGKELYVQLPNESCKGIKTLSHQSGVSTFMTLVALLNTLFNKYASQEDIILGLPVAGRTRPELEGQIGFYVNTLPVRYQFSSHNTFLELLEIVKNNLLDAFEHEQYPFDELVEKLNIPRSMNRHPIFDAMVSSKVVDEVSVTPEVDSSEQPRIIDRTCPSKFDLSVEFVEIGNAISIHVTYNTDLFRTESMSRMIGHFTTIAQEVVKNPHQKLNNINWIADEEQVDLFERKYRVESRYKVEETIVEMFDRTAIQFSSRAAVYYKGQKLSYLELHEKANAFARLLVNTYNVKKNVLVPVLLRRGLEMPVAIWGILKAGAAFVPIDLQWPEARINQILDDINASFLVTNDKTSAEKFPNRTLCYISLNILSEEKKNFTVQSQLDDPIYAFYTSGSTGRPKGALNKHLGIANRFLFMTKQYNPTESDVILLSSNYVFDASVWQLLWPVTVGMKTVIPETDNLFDLRSTIKLIEERKVTITHLVPSVMEVLVDTLKHQPELTQQLSSLRDIQVGGEALNEEKAYELKALLPNLTITNSYGPTEASISSLFYKLPDKRRGKIAIGRPMDNVEIQIMDKFQRPVAQGVVGELWLGGHCVGLGYLNNPDQTENNFIASEYSGVTDQIFYRTGDQVRLDADGEVEFVGRMDHQVKIRGYRIELGEIESTMMLHPEVKQAVVTVWEEEGVKQLAAYYCGSNVTSNQLLDFLQNRVTDYMIPSSIQRMDQIPFNTIGKIDRKALPKPIRIAPSESSEPEDEIEKIVKKIWTEVLGKDLFGVTDNFFTIGGHSLKIVQVQSRIIQSFNVEIKIKELFMLPTIKQIASLIRRLKPATEKEEFMEILID